MAGGGLGEVRGWRNVCIECGFYGTFPTGNARQRRKTTSLYVLIQEAVGGDGESRCTANRSFGTLSKRK